MSGPLDALREALETMRDEFGPDYHEVVALRAALAQVEKLVEAADDLRLWEPGHKGFAAALDRVFAALAPFDPAREDGHA